MGKSAVRPAGESCEPASDALKVLLPECVVIASGDRFRAAGCAIVHECASDADSDGKCRGRDC